MSDERDDELEAGDDFMLRLGRVELVGCHSADELKALTAAGFELAKDGYWRLELAGGVEVALEPMIYGGHWLAVYKDQLLVHAGKLEVELRPRTRDE